MFHVEHACTLRQPGAGWARAHQSAGNICKNITLAPHDKILSFSHLYNKTEDMNGLHLIADIYRCRSSAGLLTERAELEALCVEGCRNAGLTPLGAYFYQFLDEQGDAAGVTGTVVLAESHLAIHTWPETGDVTLDVYVCNFSRDNSGRARQVFAAVIDALAPEEIVSHEVVRGRLEQGVTS